jgi:hypothetical protein
VLLLPQLSLLLQQGLLQQLLVLHKCLRLLLLQQESLVTC